MTQKIKNNLLKECDKVLYEVNYSELSEINTEDYKAGINNAIRHLKNVIGSYDFSDSNEYKERLKKSIIERIDEENDESVSDSHDFAKINGRIEAFEEILEII